MDLKQKLNYHYRRFDKTQISPDPVEILHRYHDYHDIEISGFLSSVFAYGNVTQILKILERIHAIMNDQPHEFVMNYSLKAGRKLFKDLKHRFYTGEDIAALFYMLNRVYSIHGSLKYQFLLYNFPSEKNIKSSIYFFSKSLREITAQPSGNSNGIKFMFPNPYKGSACKRMNLFLRWMVRKDDIDFGLWPEISTEKLVIPVDTHIASICKELKLTKTKNVSWKMAEEITDKLRKFNPKDPVKYDFALCHIGMRKLKF